MIPVGTPVPVGVYDAEQRRWVPQDNGVVLKILGVTPTGRALLDINGDGIADSDSVLLYSYGIVGGGEVCHTWAGPYSNCATGFGHITVSWMGSSRLCVASTPV